MLEIDFLPNDYRQRDARRRVHTWRLAVVGGALALIVITAVGQRFQRHVAKEALSAIEPQYDVAVAGEQELADIDAQLKRLRPEADLAVYLEHPWPKTQLLAAVLEPLPPEIRLDQLSAGRDSLASTQFTSSNAPRMQQLPAVEEAKLAPAERDLKRLHDEYDKQSVVVRLQGTTTDTTALHAYLAEVGRNSLVSRADLESLGTDESATTPTTRFRAIVVVRPGYGQSGDPAAGKTPELAQTHHDKFQP